MNSSTAARAVSPTWKLGTGICLLGHTARLFLMHSIMELGGFMGGEHVSMLP
jgi:hypothetical protein